MRRSAKRFTSALHGSPKWAGLALACTVFATVADAQRMQFRHLGIDDGLPASHVTDVLRDRRGFMWIGTSRGVARYDSHRFRVWGPGRDMGGLPDGLVRQIFEDRTGTLWVLTASGLSRYSPATDGFITIAARAIVADSAAAPAFLTAIAEDSAGRLVVGTSAGLAQVDHVSGTASPWPLQVAGEGGVRPSVTTLHLGPDGTLWVGSSNGLYAIRDAQGGAEHWAHVTGPAAPHDSVIRTLTTDARGDLWIGTGYAGLARRDRASGRFTHYRSSAVDPGALSGDRIARVIPVRDGPGVWIAIENGGVDRFDPLSGTFRHYRSDHADPYSLGSNAVWALYHDPDLLLWVGTFSAGVDVSMPNGSAIRHYRSLPNDPRSLSYSAVTAFLVDRNERTWVATDGGGLNRFDAATGQFEHFTSQNTNLNSDAVLSLAQDGSGDVWVSTWAGGISRLDQRTRRFTSWTTANSDIPHDNVYEVLADRAGNIWVGTDNGIVARLDKARGRFAPRFNVVSAGFTWSSVLVLRELSDGRLAAGLRDGGLTLLDPRTGALEHYTAGGSEAGSLASNMVRAVFESSPGVLWVATDAGADRIDLRTRRRVHLDVENGLASRYVDGIVPGFNGRIWFSTDAGLSRYDPATGRFRTFTRADGLQSNEFLMRSAYRGPDGALYFGGNNGFNVVHPERIVEPRSTPAVVFTDLLLFNRPVRPGAPGSPLRTALPDSRSVTLGHAQNVFTLEFASLDFAAPGRARFAYRMDGFDADWQEVGGRTQASYTNLAPGRYVLHVRSSDVDGTRTISSTDLEVVITPPSWQTWWFRTIALALAGLAIVRLWRFQQRRRLEIELSKQARYDSLTELPNRALFRERLERATRRQQRAQGSADRDPELLVHLAVLYLDLDGFKSVNDTMGHAAGDQLLKVVSERLLACTRGTDTAARLGGDEFAVVLEGLRQLDEARVLAERIIGALRTPIATGHEASPRNAVVGASVGIAFWRPGTTIETLLHEADAAMYRAKHGGKNRAVIFVP